MPGNPFHVTDEANGFYSANANPVFVSARKESAESSHPFFNDEAFVAPPVIWFVGLLDFIRACH